MHLDAAARLHHMGILFRGLRHDPNAGQIGHGEQFVGNLGDLAHGYVALDDGAIHRTGHGRDGIDLPGIR